MMRGKIKNAPIIKSTVPENGLRFIQFTTPRKISNIGHEKTTRFNSAGNSPKLNPKNRTPISIKVIPNPRPLAAPLWNEFLISFSILFWVWKFYAAKLWLSSSCRNLKSFSFGQFPTKPRFLYDKAFSLFTRNKIKNGFWQKKWNFLNADFKLFPMDNWKIIAFYVKFIDKRCNIILFQSSYDKT